MTKIILSDMQVISPIGSGKPEFFRSLQAGEKGVGVLTNIDGSAFPTTLAAEAKEEGNVIRTQDIDRKEFFLNRLMARINKEPYLNYKPEKRHLMAGMGIDYFKLAGYCESEDILSGNWLKSSINSRKVVAGIADNYEFEGNVVTNISACVASTQAIGGAFKNLRNGYPGIFTVGGADSMLNHLHYMGFYKLGALTDWRGEPSEAVKPFDANRTGMVLGEGAALFTLSREDDVEKSDILATISGYASSLDSYMITDPLPDGSILAHTALRAIADAGLSPDDIDCVHCHGTGTLKNDIAESLALGIIFGERVEEIPAFSLKAQVGHCISACGAIEMCAVIYSLQEQCALPTINFDCKDPGIKLNVLKQIRPMPVRHILKLNAAFGGQNAALVISKYE